MIWSVLQIGWFFVCLAYGLALALLGQMEEAAIEVSCIYCVNIINICKLPLRVHTHYRLMMGLTALTLRGLKGSVMVRLHIWTAHNICTLYLRQYLRLYLHTIFETTFAHNIWDYIWIAHNLFSFLCDPCHRPCPQHLLNHCQRTPHPRRKEGEQTHFILTTPTKVLENSSAQSPTPIWYYSRTFLSESGQQVLSMKPDKTLYHLNPLHSTAPPSWCPGSSWASSSWSSSWFWLLPKWSELRKQTFGLFWLRFSSNLVASLMAATSSSVSGPSG